jgi:hypothetical protein
MGRMLAGGTTADSQAAQLDVYRRLGPSARAGLAGDLSCSARELVRDGIRSRYPSYGDREVDGALFRILYGDDLFRRVWPGRPPPAP